MKRNIKYLLIGIAISSLLAVYLYDRYFFYQTIEYPDFGIAIPGGYDTHGIDVSRYQHKINWKAVSEMRDKGQRISFAITKCTEGTSILDPYFKHNWKQMAENHLLRGAYLYFHPNAKAKEQARLFIQHCKLSEGDLPPVIDIEEAHGMSAARVQESLQICLDALENEYHCKPIIYTGADFYTKMLGPAFDAYPLWVAHYNQPLSPRINRPWTIWQHNCKGRVNGIRGEVDFNVVNGSLLSLQKLCL